MISLVGCQPPAVPSAGSAGNPVATEDHVALSAKQTIEAALAPPSATPTETPAPTAMPAATPTETLPPTPDWAATETAESERIAAGIAATLTAMPTHTPTPTPTWTPTATPDLAATATKIAQAMATAVAATLTAQPTATPPPRPINTATPTRPPEPIRASSPLRIAYVRGSVGNTDIYVYNWETGEQYAVANQSCDEAEPSWSPDGRSLLYQSNCAASYDIYRVTVDSRRAERLTTWDDLDEREPAASPDGAQIVLRVSPRGAGRNNDGELWIMQANGANARGLGIAGRTPVWSPDGRYLAFMSERQDGWEIYRYEFASGATLRLTHCSANCRFPDWSPDGQYVVYHTTTGPESTTAQTIWYIPAAGGAPTQLVSGRGAGRASWSNSGLVVFNSDAGIEIVAANGSGRRVIIPANQNWAPAWSE